MQSLSTKVTPEVAKAFAELAALYDESVSSTLRAMIEAAVNGGWTTLADVRDDEHRGNSLLWDWA